MFLLYQITNLLNGKIYIGAHSGTPDDGYWGSGIAIRKAIGKYGIENFQKDILGVCSSEKEMFDRERQLVNEDFVRRNDTYNLCVGGDGGPRGGGAPKGNRNHLGHTHSDAARQKMSANNCMKRPEFKERLRQRQLGRKRSPATIQKQREALRANWAMRKGHHVCSL